MGIILTSGLNCLFKSSCYLSPFLGFSLHFPVLQNSIVNVLWQTFPFFGVVPAILDEAGEELEGEAEGYLVKKITTFVAS